MYNFDCCKNITEWGVDVFFNHQNNYAIDFQAWRPSPTAVDSPNSTSLYSLVGNNRFTSISLSSGIAIITPSPQDYIQFQPGDVLGFYVENANNHTNGVVIRVSPSILTNEMIWFASIPRTTLSSNVRDCFYSVGENGNLNTLTHAAPVISIETGQYVDKVKIN